jgi:hypothetical protein
MVDGVTHIFCPSWRMTREGLFTRCRLGTNNLSRGVPFSRVTAKEADVTCRKCLQPSIFVFGSNMAGRHGAGAAKFAKDHRGAIYGKGVGPQGQSYAIPTKDSLLRVLPLKLVEWYSTLFLNYAREKKDTLFQLTRIGCGLAGYSEYQIAPFFRDAPINVVKPLGWETCRDKNCSHLGIQHKGNTVESPERAFCSVKGCTCSGIAKILREI